MKKVSIIFFILIFLLQPITLVSAADRLQLTAQKAGNVPQLDGVITEGEWGKPVAEFTKDSKQVRFTYGDVDEERLPKGAELYAMWDDEYLYIGAIVTSTSHQNNKKNASVWRGDSLFIGLGLAEDQAAEYRFIFALGGGGIPLGNLLNFPNETLDGTGMNVEILLHKSDYFVARAEDKTTYEVRFRWSDYTLDGRKIEEGFQFYLNVELHTQAKKGDPVLMCYGTYYYSIHWQYPMVKLKDQNSISSPTSKLTPTPTSMISDAEIVAEQSAFTPVPSMSPLRSKPMGKHSEANFWWYLLLLVPLAALIVTVIYIIKKHKQSSN